MRDSDASYVLVEGEGRGVRVSLRSETEFILREKRFTTWHAAALWAYEQAYGLRVPVEGARPPQMERGVQIPFPKYCHGCGIRLPIDRRDSINGTRVKECPYCEYTINYPKGPFPWVGSFLVGFSVALIITGAVSFW